MQRIALPLLLAHTSGRAKDMARLPALSQPAGIYELFKKDKN